MLLEVTVSGSAVARTIEPASTEAPPGDQPIRCCSDVPVCWPVPTLVIEFHTYRTTPVVRSNWNCSVLGFAVAAGWLSTPFHVTYSTPPTSSHTMLPEPGSVGL